MPVAADRLGNCPQCPVVGQDRPRVGPGTPTARRRCRLQFRPAQVRAHGPASVAGGKPTAGPASITGDRPVGAVAGSDPVSRPAVPARQADVGCPLMFGHQPEHRAVLRYGSGRARLRSCRRRPGVPPVPPGASISTPARPGLDPARAPQPRHGYPSRLSPPPALPGPWSRGHRWRASPSPPGSSGPPGPTGSPGPPGPGVSGPSGDVPLWSLCSASIGAPVDVRIPDVG